MMVTLNKDAQLTFSQQIWDLALQYFNCEDGTHDISDIWAIEDQLLAEFMGLV